MIVERLEEENDVERKIFVDTALQSLRALSAGLLEDGDGKRNETVAESPCAELPAEMCAAAREALLEVSEKTLGEGCAKLEAEGRSEGGVGRSGFDGSAERDGADDRVGDEDGRGGQIAGEWRGVAVEGGVGEGEDERGRDRVAGCRECFEAMERILCLLKTHCSFSELSDSMSSVEVAAAHFCSPHRSTRAV